jgi:gas vesicle protein
MKTGRAMRTVGIALAAGAAGAGVALLFAPQAGARTRRMFRRKAEDVGHDVREAYQRVRASGNGAARALAYRLRMKLTPRKVVERLAGA